MFNHFRTLLLNLPYAQDPEEHIPKEFGTGIGLPTPLNSFRNVLFPSGASRFYCRFLVTNYLQLTESTHYRNNIVSYDSRITYDLSEDIQFFKTYRNSLPTVSNTSFPLFITGYYQNNIASGDLSDEIEIRQLSNSLNIDVYSITKNQYYLQSVPLVFTNNMSQLVEIPGIGIKFQIGGNNFTGSSNKRWSFLAEAPYVFDVAKFYQDLSSATDITERMFSYRHDEIPQGSENLWRQHQNIVYRLTGIFISYVERVNTLWQPQ